MAPCGSEEGVPNISLFCTRVQPLQQHQDARPAAAHRHVLPVQGPHRAQVGGPQEHKRWLLDGVGAEQGPEQQGTARCLVAAWGEILGRSTRRYSMRCMVDGPKYLAWAAWRTDCMGLFCRRGTSSLIMMPPGTGLGLHRRAVHRGRGGLRHCRQHPAQGRPD